MSLYPYEDEILKIVDLDRHNLIRAITKLIYRAMQYSYTRGRNDEKNGVGQKI